MDGWQRLKAAARSQGEHIVPLIRLPNQADTNDTNAMLTYVATFPWRYLHIVSSIWAFPPCTRPCLDSQLVVSWTVQENEKTYHAAEKYGYQEVSSQDTCIEKHRVERVISEERSAFQRVAS